MQCPCGAGSDPVVEQPAWGALSDNLEHDIVDPQPGARTCRNVSGVDCEVASRRTRVDRVSEVDRATLEQLTRLDGNVAMFGAVIAVAGKSLSRFGGDGVDRAGRNFAPGGDVHCDYLHDATVSFGSGVWRSRETFCEILLDSSVVRVSIPEMVSSTTESVLYLGHNIAGGWNGFPDPSCRIAQIDTNAVAYVGDILPTFQPESTDDPVSK